eukprot:3727135-Amphidinium_carterae.1
MLQATVPRYGSEAYASGSVPSALPQLSGKTPLAIGAFWNLRRSHKSRQLLLGGDMGKRTSSFDDFSGDVPRHRQCHLSAA